ncbi:NAD-dependent epimerase/dehydratase family protein [Prosthecobacter sp.]|uniref:NAD-dependent epimerase/dehydratase family protein n=1 Tax=Prosthecobacter sp. TaxID=1965333 RepID=UPI003784089B
MNPESILITGGAGFIGSNLACHLRSRYPRAVIVCMDNLYRRGSEINISRLQEMSIQFHLGDIRIPAEFPTGPFEVLIECSAEPSVLAGQDGSPDYLFQTNLVGAYHCLEKARLWNSRVIFLSTSRVYPVAPLEAHGWVEDETRFRWLEQGTAGISRQGVSEALDLRGARSLYGFTKLAAEQLIEEYRASFGLRAVINRCGVVAGPWQFGKVDQGVIALWAMAHLFNRPLSYIGYGGNGKQVRDVLHVQDLCELIALQISGFDAWDGWVGNVAGGLVQSISLQELTQLCKELGGHSISVRSDSAQRPFDLRLFVADCTHLFQRTDWRPARDLRRIVADTMAWAVEHHTLLQKIG